MSEKKFAHLLNQLNLFKNFYTKPLKVHILWAFIFIFVLLVITYYSINLFTYHGQYAKVPDVVGMDQENAFKTIEDHNLIPVIGDSLFLLQYPPKAIIKQIPESGASVKKNRNIYLILNKTTPPLIDVPKVVGLNLSIAEGIIKSSGLKIKDTLYRSDLAKNIILELRYEGKILNSASKVPLGEKISVVIGNGAGNLGMVSNESNGRMVWTPDLIGKKLSIAQKIISDSKLNLLIQNANEFPNESETDLYIIKQNPFRYDSDNQVTRVPQNSLITVWVSTKDPLQE